MSAPLRAPRPHRLLGPLVALLALVAGLVVGPASSADAAVSETNAARIALHQVGDPYSYGAAGPSAFDCSGLVYYSYHRAGFGRVPRTASAQAAASRHISKGSMHFGDLMFFTNGGGVYHSAIFLRWDHGSALMVHAPRPGERVKVQRAWTNSWFGGRV